MLKVLQRVCKTPLNLTNKNRVWSSNDRDKRYKVIYNPAEVSKLAFN